MGREMLDERKKRAEVLELVTYEPLEEPLGMW